MRLQFPRCLGAFAALYLAADCATVRHQRPDIEHVFVIVLTGLRPFGSDVFTRLNESH